MEKDIRVAFFGNGFTRSTILPCLRQVDGVRFVGIASPNQEKAKETAEEFGIEEVSDDHREILGRTSPDLVFVVTPPHRHYEQTVDALRTGCHVVCEKPTALSGGESLKMWEEAKERPGQIAWIDHELRFDPRRKLLRKWIQDGRIGEPIRATYLVHSGSRRSAEFPWTWWSDENQGGGALGALGSHAVDALRHLLGEVQVVRGALHTTIKSRRDPLTGTERGVTADDFAGAWIRFRSGALATMEVSVVEGERRHEVSVTGTEGTVRILEQGPLLAAFGSSGHLPLEDHTPEDDLPTNGELGIPDTDWARAFLRMCRELVHSIRTGERNETAATLEDGHRNQLVLDAIRHSSERSDWTEVRSEGKVGLK
ncbi:MAG: Gfo/Idh/MocA family oxidoreductase [Candidatus Eisenbacteria bacterium]|uniref:Gfo/Idh/MocA family oxidoreductase n=1 Tax=Eiseniibacteriota bacterium TaxID=2212470 RepID=A0A956NCM2_UNCEI|nr:Gfo/Idh/MocA family oxidoreductase [Candidatus Eisenbacteria bacterium]MCB9463206.1 Gfo/Idh/MocA family oxidoreductase [Candidatus Eisenbacteria bacterium]